MVHLGALATALISNFNFLSPNPHNHFNLILAIIRALTVIAITALASTFSGDRYPLNPRGISHTIHGLHTAAVYSYRNDRNCRNLKARGVVYSMTVRGKMAVL